MNRSMKHFWKPRALTATVLVGCLQLGACGTYTSASMRIDVDVYQGALSVEPQAQWGSLLGDIQEGTKRLEALNETYWTVYKKYPKSSEAQKLKRVIDDIEYLEDELDKLWVHAVGWDKAYRAGARAVGGLGQASEEMIQNLSFSVPGRRADDEARAAEVRTSKLATQRQALTETERLQKEGLSPAESIFGQKTTVRIVKRDLINVLQHATEIGERLRVAAVSYAGYHVSHAELSRLGRAASVDFSAFAAELSNALRSKADALLKQAGGADRRELPLSDQLRTASTSAYVDLYIWNRAAGPRYFGDPSSTAYFEDRVNVIKGLYDDESWRTINTAYASGQGNTAMAFIKDDIGNWNLKRFDNDPTQLLQAYKSVGMAAIKTAVTLAGGPTPAALDAVKSLSGAQRALALADQVTYGAGAQSTSVDTRNPTVDKMHERTTSRLKTLQAEMTAEEKRIAADLEAVGKKLADAQAAVDKVNAEAKQQRDAANKAGAGQTPDALRESARTSRSQQALAAKDTADASAKINENNARILLLQDQIAQAEGIVKSNTGVAGAAAAAEVAGAQSRIATLSSEREALARDNIYLGQAVTNRTSTSTALGATADSNDGKAQTVETYETALNAILRDKVKPAQDEVARLTKEQERLTALRDRELYVEAVKRTREILEMHETMIDEIQTLNIESPPEAKAETPAVPGDLASRVSPLQ
ncbi:MAG: hypothetical protein IT566_18355 [Rhodospirillaceae bacterium]|nr:hypothetical protein [Rhodospirillaceae bacterium]